MAQPNCASGTQWGGMEACEAVVARAVACGNVATSASNMALALWHALRCQRPQTQFTSNEPHRLVCMEWSLMRSRQRFTAAKAVQSGSERDRQDDMSTSSELFDQLLNCSVQVLVCTLTFPARHCSRPAAYIESVHRALHPDNKPNGKPYVSAACYMIVGQLRIPHAGAVQQQEVTCKRTDDIILLYK
eukprot:TRINITY_DN1624_c0_g2_i1.p1 TRINITY_DN1624_c0_g2~~TRINITY_DN1624_c0_g2_i1.p1  ORF type:complete len:207 (+),score=11.33 TRINITY_DN1624_c0_g2_i1:59-622(+)